ncbi:hypothetical protein FRC00_003023 [Tulasnella sp. 408]|nr:hypothetical protein FRC00_003023 [Tulasnella sp. 408]
MKLDRLDFFTEAGEKIDQWRSLEIQAENNIQDALAFIQTQNPPPRLELLRIESEKAYGRQEGPGAALFRGAPATGLKHVKLSRAPINILSLGLADLKSLILQHIPSTTAADIVTILTNSPTLITLRLAKFGDALLRNQPPTHEANPSPIHLPFLVDLELDDLPLPFLDFLLSNLAVPQLRSLQVIHKPLVIAQLLAPTTGNLNTTLTSVTSGARDYEIILSDGCKITIGGLVIHLKSELIHRAMDNVDENFGGLSDHLRGLGLADLPLHLTCRFYVPGLADLDWFTRKTNVISLTFSFGVQRDDDVNTVIALLSRPTPGRSPIWLLPQLEVFKIDVETKELRRLVVDMIKARHAAVPDSFLGAHGPVPKLYREIWLYHYGNYPLPSPLDEITIEVVQAAKGADVHWEVPKANVSDRMECNIFEKHRPRRAVLDTRASGEIIATPQTFDFNPNRTLTQGLLYPASQTSIAQVPYVTVAEAIAVT